MVVGNKHCKLWRFLGLSTLGWFLPGLWHLLYTNQYLAEYLGWRRGGRVRVIGLCSVPSQALSFVSLTPGDGWTVPGLPASLSTGIVTGLPQCADHLSLPAVQHLGKPIDIVSISYHF